jgi:hypothetical protein
MCHPIWLYSRKYGTVWYHPASSKLWYLTTLSFVNFQGKLTGTSCDSLHVWSQLVRLAVCLALGAHFASTATNSLNPSSFVFSFSFIFSSSFLGLAWELHVRSRKRDGWSGCKLDLVWTFVVCIDDWVWFLKALCCHSRFPFGDFRCSCLFFSWREFWGWFLAGFLLGVTMRTLCLFG